MYSVIKSSDHIAPYIMEYVITKIVDFDTFPKQPTCAPGSTCVCLENSSVYMLGDDDIWHEL